MLTGSGREELLELINERHSGRQLASFYTGRTDSLLQEIYLSLFGTRSDPGKLCVIAIGGYGRGELAPYSDVDIMLFSPDRSSAEQARQFLYRLWDANLPISHSFRTPDDCITEAKKDIRTRTSLLEHRFIAGDADLYRLYKERVYPEVAYRNQRAFVKEKMTEAEQRYQKCGSSVFLLEPDIKEGKGGLRDIHTILWLAKIRYRAAGIEDLSAALSPEDLSRLLRSYDFLLKVRFCLHLLSGRRNDKLSFEFHEPLAEMLRFAASQRHLASERFMRYYYLKAAAVRDVAAGFFDQCCESSGRFLPVIVKKRVTDNFVVSGERIVSLADLSKDADLIMESFAAMAMTGRRFSTKLKEAIRKNLMRVTGKMTSSPGATGWFLELLRSRRAYEALHEMHRLGVLGRFLPEFGRLSFLVVYEPYHQFTVDEHSLRAVRKLVELEDTQYKTLEHHAHLYRRMKHKEAVILALLLHDIGKGKISRERQFPAGRIGEGGHEREGYLEIKEVLERFSLDPTLRKRVTFLVKNHTLMSSLAFKRDIGDPDVIASFAGEVGDCENLDCLYLITYADMAAVNPGYWNNWKSHILREFYENTLRSMEGAAGKGPGRIGDVISLRPDEEKSVRSFLGEMPERYLIGTSPEKMVSDFRLSQEVRQLGFGMRVHKLSGGAAEVVIGALDHPGLFSKIVGVFSSLGMNIYRARLYTARSGLVVDHIQIANWQELWWDGMLHTLEQKLKEAVTGGGTVTALKTGKQRGSCPEHFYFTGRSAPFVEIDNETLQDGSILEFFARDRIGLLHEATSLLHEQDIDIISAQINTESGLAHDIFSVQKGRARIDGQDVCDLLALLWERLR